MAAEDTTLRMVRFSPRARPIVRAMARTPGWGCAVLLVAGVLALMLGGLALYARHTVLDPHAFADRATGTLHQDEVRDEIVQRIADREIDNTPALAARRPVLEAAAADVVQNPSFPGEFNAGAAALHEALFTDRSQATPLALPGAGGQLRSAVAQRSLPAARMLPPTDPELLRLGGGRLENALRDAAPVARSLASLFWLALLAGLMLLALAARRAPTRRLGLRRAAFGLAIAGFATVAATSIGRAAVLSSFDTSHGDAVVSTIWSAFLADLRLWALATGAVGVVAAAALEPGVRGAWRTGLQHVMNPRGSAARLARAGGLILLAALLVWMPEVPLDLALVSAAGLLVFSAAAEVVRVARRSLIR
jgi:hypothetical protein